MDTRLPDDPLFNKHYHKHCKHLKLKGLRPKTIEAYARAIRRIGNYFDAQIDHLTMDQLLDYFNDLLDSHSWSAVKLDLYGLKFFYTYVLNKTWEEIPLIKPPKTTRIPDILTVDVCLCAGTVENIYAKRQTIEGSRRIYRHFAHPLSKIGLSPPHPCGHARGEHQS